MNLSNKHQATITRVLVNILLVVALCVSWAISAVAKDMETKTGFHQSTEWNITSSLAFDAICFLNTLTADSFYLDYYQFEYAKFAPLITPDVKAALDNLKRKVKDEAGGIISADLCLYFSATSDSTIDDLQATLKNSMPMQANLKLTPYYSDDGWNLFESIKSDLDTIFKFYKKINFETYWRDNILPKELAQIDSIEDKIAQFNIVPEIERLLGRPLDSNKITVYMLFYSQPHGIKIIGTRFLTDQAWPFEIVVRNAVHEMMHPPYRADDPGLKGALESLKKDDFLMDKVLHHNPSFGYNSFDGFIEEDCVQALDQIINEKLNVAKDARKRWLENDDGMHVFAIALYQVMKAEDYNHQDETFPEFLVRNINNSQLGPGKIKGLYNWFYSSSPTKK